ncbi:endoplasmic reticulum-Golgi intermediate compartment protein 3-like [Gossypium australe]|uniref:Endoplasmic reticulum-Golgi intermediate compartment protein 3-like n=1 Tax=Gossypium australe TaxID=47621 RepID=A0A5B6X6B6_9ROSI|nr:endoplasmic reticulum-Golgi intermediate compartment protein 3-like [Gossypium australe]
MKNTVLSKLRNLDAYPKVNEDFFTRSLSGGIITLVSSLAILLLVFSEFRLYLHTVMETKLLVDTSRGETFRINKHDIIKKRINTNGDVIESKPDGIGAPKIEKPLQRHGGRLEQNETYCGSCFGAEQSDDDCCNSCEEVRDAYRRKGWAMTNADLIDQCKREGFFERIKEQEGEGCNVQGSLEVNRVAGNFHFAPGKTFHQSNIFFDDLMSVHKDSYNVRLIFISHRINRLAFGEYFPGVVNPLDGGHWTHETSNGMYQYFIKVVPTIYTDIRGRTVNSNQYSVTEHFKDLEYISPNAQPGVFFYYDFSPIKVTFKEEHSSFLHFITNICAVIGGIFTVAGIIDTFVYHGQRRMKKKMEIGKFR